jgi:glycosyltransferase involved in cell wall biosynthesis
MRVLMTSHVDLRNSQHNRPHEIVRHLAEKHDVTVISINDWWKGSQDSSEKYRQEFKEVLSKIRYLYLTERRASLAAQELLSRRPLREILKEDFDVHLNYDGLFVGLSASKKYPTVMDLADDVAAMMGESSQIPKSLRPLARGIGRAMIRKNIREADYVTLSTAGLKDLYRVPENKARIIPNGVDPDRFKNYGNTRYELNLRGFNVGYVGVLREWVNLEPVFRALGAVNSEIKMIVIGKEGRYDENISLAKQCAVSDRVNFIGTIPYRDIPRYICAMDVGIIPFEISAIADSAVPLKLFEYMACEKPVISTPIKGVESIAGDSVLYARGAAEWADAMRRLFEDGELCAALGKRGRKIVEDGYTWKRITTELESVLLETAGMTA